MIYKYYLSINKPTKIETLGTYEILDIQCQDNSICVWLDVAWETDSTHFVTFNPVMTGYSPPAGMLYIATVQTQEGFVLHYYV